MKVSDVAVANLFCFFEHSRAKCSGTYLTDHLALEGLRRYSQTYPLKLLFSSAIYIADCCCQMDYLASSLAEKWMHVNTSLNHAYFSTVWEDYHSLFRRPVHATYRNDRSRSEEAQGPSRR